MSMLFYIIFVGALAATDAIGNVTVTKDKRQIQQPTQNFVPSNHQIGGGHQQPHHYAASNEQITAIPQNYYRYVQRLVQNQQPSQQQYQDSSKEIASQHSQPRHNAQPQAKQQNQYVYFNEPQVQYQPVTDNQHELEPKAISEEEYLELVRQQHGGSENKTAAPKYHQSNRGGSQYKTPKEYQSTYVPNEQPQSYLKSYVNPLGEFSLEKELAQLEKSNKAIYHGNSETDIQQSSKRERLEFKPSHQFVEYQQDQFLPPEYAQFSGTRPLSQKLISNPYERDESESEKATDNQPEYQIRYASPTETPVRYYQPEAVKTSGPKSNSFVPLPNHQHSSSDSSNNSPHANPNLAKKHSQLIYQKQHQHTTSSPSAHHGQINNKKQPTKTSGSLQQFQSNNQKAPSQSSIFVSQSTGIQQKPQENDQQQLQQQQQQLEIQQQQEIQQQHQAQQQYQHYQRPQHQQQPQSQHQAPRLPLTNPNRPLTQEEFQALVDAGYKVQAIPIPVPVPVSAEEYAQHQQQHQQQQQEQAQNQQQQQHHHQQQQHQYQQQQHPYHLPPQSSNPIRTQPPIRPQPSTKHYVRYQPQTEGVLSSYLRPFLEQYNNLMGGKL